MLYEVITFEEAALRMQQQKALHIHIEYKVHILGNLGDQLASITTFQIFVRQLAVQKNPAFGRGVFICQPFNISQ